MTPPEGTTPDRPDTPEPTTGGDAATRPVPQAESTQPVAYEYPSTGAPEAAPATPAPAGPAAPAPGADAPESARRRTGVVVAAVAGVAIIGGGAAVAFTALNGGGSQPADVLPGDAIAYTRLDIDPSAGQKLDAVRFFQKLPEAEGILAADDVRQGLWEAAAEDDECLAGIDYATQVRPWLGERVGAAVRPPAADGDEPRLVVAVQVTDEAAAAAGLPAILDCADSGPSDVRMRDGYALITPEGEGDEALSAVGAGTLSQNADFVGDMGALGDQGVMSVWYDGSEVFGLLEETAGGLGGLESLGVPGVPSTGKDAGRGAMALRFGSDFLELATVARDVKQPYVLRGDGTAVATLPDDTMAAVHLSDGAKAGTQAWKSFSQAVDASGTLGPGESVDDALDYLGITMPDDLEALLGTSFTLAMPKQDLGDDMPTVGLVVTTAGADRAAKVLDTIEQLAGGADLLTTKVEGDRLVAATNPGYVNGLDGEGTLGETDAFRTSVGDVDDSVFVAYADLDALEPTYLEGVEEKDRPFVEAMRAVGVNVRMTSDSEARSTIRLVID